MTRFSGVIGIKQPRTEISPGIFSDPISESNVVGKIFNKKTVWKSGDSHQDLATANHLVVFKMEEQFNNTFNNIVYVIWQNTKWSVVNVIYKRPNVEVTLGGVYNE